MVEEMVYKCVTCGKSVGEVWDPSEGRMIPESLYWYSIDGGPTFTAVHCSPECMLIHHTRRNKGTL